MEYNERKEAEEFITRLTNGGKECAVLRYEAMRSEDGLRSLVSRIGTSFFLENPDVKGEKLNVRLDRLHDDNVVCHVYRDGKPCGCSPFYGI